MSFFIERGVVGKCFLSTLNFDATKCVPHVIMHLCDEDIFFLETRLLLNKLVIVDKIIYLDQLNVKTAFLSPHREFTIPPSMSRDEILSLSKLSLSSVHSEERFVITPKLHVLISLPKQIRILAYLDTTAVTDTSLKMPFKKVMKGTLI